MDPLLAKLCSEFATSFYLVNRQCYAVSCCQNWRSFGFMKTISLLQKHHPGPKAGRSGVCQSRRRAMLLCKRTSTTCAARESTAAQFRQAAVASTQTTLGLMPLSSWTPTIRRKAVTTSTAISPARLSSPLLIPVWFFPSPLTLIQFLMLFSFSKNNLFVCLL